MEQLEIKPILLTKTGKAKKIQELKTENINEYMKDYIKNSKDCICDICGGKYKSYQKYLHNKGKIHTLKYIIQQQNNLIKSNSSTTS
jgi:hypothetical protein